MLHDVDTELCLIRFRTFRPKTAGQTTPPIVHRRRRACRLHSRHQFFVRPRSFSRRTRHVRVASTKKPRTAKRPTVLASHLAIGGYPRPTPSKREAIRARCILARCIRARCDWLDSRRLFRPLAFDHGCTGRRPRFVVRERRWAWSVLVTPQSVLV